MKWLCVGVVLTLLNCPAWALNSVYLAQVPVASQAPEERAKAAAVGLREILWRTTGTKVSEQTPGLSSLFSRAETYVESFQYGAITNNPQGFKQEVLLQFSPQALSQLIQDYHLPLWPNNRPKVLVWLIQNSEGAAPEFIKDPAHPILLALQEAARQRGLTLVYPHYDSQDMDAISTSQVQQEDNEALMNASFRYQLDTLLVGRLTATGGTWQSDHRGEKHTLSGSDPATGLHMLADALAKRYAVISAAGPNASSSNAIISVDVNNFERFHGLISYLKKQSQLSAFKLLSTTPDRVLVELNLRGDIAQFDNGLTLDRQLEPLTPNTGDTGNLDKPLAYRWIAK